jgi:hypothetical protein
MRRKRNVEMIVSFRLEAVGVLLQALAEENVRRRHERQFNKLVGEEYARLERIAETRFRAQAENDSDGIWEDAA